MICTSLCCIAIFWNILNQAVLYTVSKLLWKFEKTNSVGFADCETDPFESSNDHKGKVKSVAFIKGSQKDTDF